MKRYLYLLYLLLFSLSVWGESYRVTDVTGFNDAVKRVHPGDSIVLVGNTWKDVELVFKGEGAEGNPVVLAAENPGSCFLTGKSCLRLSGKYLVVDGLVFRDGSSPRKSVIEFRTSSVDAAWHCTVKNCVIDAYNQSQKEIEDHWVDLWGRNNTVEYCYFAGKKNKGTTLVIWPNGEGHNNNHHRIYRNYFGNRPALGSNGGETIRIGTSTYSMEVSASAVEENFFEHCDGETEIISVKSCRNRIVGNAFFECQGSVVLRHGNENVVAGNVFIGNGVKETGGVRIINAGHKIYNNYMYALAGEGFRAPVAVMNGVPDSPLNRYNQVKDVEISCNTLVDCALPFQLCVGRDTERTLAPDNVTVSGNIVYSPDEAVLVKSYDDTKGFRFMDNLLVGKNGVISGEYGGLDAKYRIVDIDGGKLKNVAADAKSDAMADEDISGNKRAVPSVIGAFLDPMSGFGKKFVPDAENCGPSFRYRPESVSAKAEVRRIDTDVLAKTVRQSASGDVIELAADEFVLEKKIVVDHDLTIRTAPDQTSKAVISIDDKTSSTIALFELRNGAHLTLENIVLAGKREGAKPAKYAVIVSEKGNLDPCGLNLRGCEVRDFSMAGGCVVMARKGSFCDSVYVDSSVFNNICRGFCFDREKDDKGLYNVEHIVLNNSSFRNFAQWAVVFYRGGNDESTTGGSLVINHCVFDNVNNREKQVMIKQTGLAKCEVSNTVFCNSPLVTAPLKVVKGYLITNCCILNSGRMKVVDKTLQTGIYYQMDKIQGGATDGKNIGLTD